MATILISTIFTLLLLSSPLCSSAHRGGFSVDLIHRDSPRSPLYDPKETQSERFAKAFQRSISRALRFNPNLAVSPNDVQAEIISNRGEYLMNISLGTPPVEILAIADTGSDLIWTQCKPCQQCYSQEAPLFDPHRSSTYRDVSCSSSQCEVLGKSSCSQANSCLYSMSYGDKSYTRGNLAVDTVTLGSTKGRPVSVPKITIGCGHNNDGTFDEKGSGIVGLGGGAVSLISQLGDSIGGKFSYCLIPLTSTSKDTSKFSFGSEAVVSGPGAVSTSLIKSNPDTFYFLNLLAISVNGHKIRYTSSPFGTADGNIIIDSGTTLTLLPTEFYSELESAVADSIDAKGVQDPQSVLSLCYRASSDLKLPKITAHFDGADVDLNDFNTFIQVSREVVCFAFGGVNNMAIYGNVAQMNFLVGYDTASGNLSFKPADCTKM